MKHIIESAYTILGYIIIILYILGLLGIWEASPKYLGIAHGTFNIVLAGILIYFFNPWTKIICSPFHKKVVFSAGLVILLQTSIMQSIISTKK